MLRGLTHFLALYYSLVFSAFYHLSGEVTTLSALYHLSGEVNRVVLSHCTCPFSVSLCIALCQTPLTITSLFSVLSFLLFLLSSFPQVGQILKTAETAATYLAFVPSDEVMSNNIRVYTSQYKLQPEDFSPRQVNWSLAVYRRSLESHTFFLAHPSVDLCTLSPFFPHLPPFQEYVAIKLKLDTEQRLLHFATHRQPKKKEGRRGDAQIKHQEL